MSEPPTILVADDSRLVRTVMARTLESRGYQVITAEDGVATVEMAWSQLPSLVLLDAEGRVLEHYQGLDADQAWRLETLINRTLDPRQQLGAAVTHRR